MQEKNTKTNQADFLALLNTAQNGNGLPLNQFFEQLYRRKKVGLLKLAGSEDLAKECFQVAVSEFWEKCVKAEQQLPNSNIEGYIYSMARFNCIDRQRKAKKYRTVSDDVAGLERNVNLMTAGKNPLEIQEEANAENLKTVSLHKAIKRLSEKCQQLFKAILEEGLTSAKDLQQVLGLADQRRVAVLQYECKKRLKVLATAELKQLLQENR